MGDLGSIPGLGSPLEKEMATHSNTRAWRIPWTKEPGSLQSTGSQSVGHDRVTKVNYKHLSGASPVAGSKGSACNAGTIGLIPGQEEPLEKGMATHSSVLAWRIPMDRGAWRAAVRGVKRVRHD